tara:strand:+ start:492 stop:944 length:453 start_codon:yes stop_codon:yes gene_type:complete
MFELKNLDIINTTDIKTVNIINNDHYPVAPGKFRFISKCRAGYMTCTDARDFDDERLYNNPESVLSRYKKGALHTVEYKPSGSDNYFTVFAKKGNKIIMMDEAIMAGLDVGTINGIWYNTNLMDSEQYRFVGAKTWADKAFVANAEPVTA